MKLTTLTVHVAGILMLGAFMGCVSAPDVTSLEVGGEAELFNGKDLTGWNVLTADYFDTPGKVSVADGAMVLGVGSDLTGVQWAGEMLTNDYAISLEGRRTKGSDFFCGLTFPIGESYVSLILGGWGGTAVGLSNVNDMSAIENNTSQWVEFVQNKWYSIEVRVTQGKVRVWLDDKKIMDQKIEGNRFTIWPQQEPVRPLGVATYGTEGAFRRIAVKRLAE
jgi:hypothetical protein